jgi:hypothetical protein
MCRIEFIREIIVPPPKSPVESLDSLRQMRFVVIQRFIIREKGMRDIPRDLTKSARFIKVSNDIGRAWRFLSRVRRPGLGIVLQ